MLRIILIWIGLILSGFNASGQIEEFLFRKISPPEGFTFGNIKTIAEDNNGFIWFGTEHGLYRFNSRKVDKYTYQSNEINTIPNDNIEKLLKDKKDRLWILTANGICIFNEQTQDFIQLKLKNIDEDAEITSFNDIIENSLGEFFVIRNNKLCSINLKDSTIQTVNFHPNDAATSVSFAVFDNSDNLWIGTFNGHVFKSPPPYHEFQLVCHHREDRIQSICQDNATFWIGYEFQGADHINEQGLIIDHYSESSASTFKLPSNRVRAIVKDESNRIWIGTYNGISLVTREHRAQIIKKDFYNNLPHNSIHSLFVDSKDGLWIGTWSGGLAYLNKYDNQFLHFNRNQDKNSLYNNIVSSICQDSNGNIWVATEDGGLNKFNRQQKEFKYFSVKDTENGPTNIKCIVSDNNNLLWIGTYGKGIWTFDIETETFYKPSFLNPEIKNIYTILIEKNGIWIGTFGDGLFFYDLDNKNLTKFTTDYTNPTSISSNSIRVLLTDSYGGLWVGTQNGLNYLPKGANSFTRYFSNNTRGLTISNNQIFSLFEDMHGQIWIGTGGGGVDCYNPGDGSIAVLTKENGLSGNNVFGILEDGKGNMWFSTENGITRYSPGEKSFKNFSTEDGLQGKQFIPGAAFATQTGEFMFGGPNGFNLFNPENLSENPLQPDVFITNLEINNEKVDPKNPKIPFLKAVNTTEILELRHEQNSLAFDFVSNNYIQSTKNQFRYRMLNYQDDWINAGSESRAIFTKIPPGNYTFEVIGSNNDGIWNTKPARLEIEILAPFWKSNVAYFIYFFVFLISVWFLRKEIILRNNLKRQILIEKVKRENEEELHQMKLQFFTNISHEFRTPLTLILSPLEVIMNKKYHDNDTREHLTMIQRNAQRLRMLINQIIDFRRFELNKMVYSPAKTDIISMCMGICDHFEVHARDKSISFYMASSFKKLEMKVDKDKLDKILFNLLSNAFKFTPEGGNICLNVEENEADALIEKSDFSTNPELTGKVLAIHVSDSGPGITTDEIAAIFERFNKNVVNNQFQGTGIGLHLSREYTHLHNGAITIKRLPEKGVIFSVLLPIQNEIKIGETKSEILKSWIDTERNPVPEDESSFLPAGSKNEPSTSVLIVEDNYDMLKQIKHLLKNDFKVITASNGLQGLELAREIFPDIIISDIVMPGIDGIELCKNIKNDIQTSHIPVILLTAVSETEKHIKGLDTGADAYIIKPFDNNLLKAQIANLIKAKERLKKAFKESEEKWASDSNLNQRDKNLVEKSAQIVEKHLLDPNFSVEQLAEELGVSRSSLHRKMRVLINQSATEFIRYVRMKKALKFLKEGNLNIDEIGFAVGFNSHSYFSQCFKKLYGKTPTEYLAELKMNKELK